MNWERSPHWKGVSQTTSFSLWQGQVLSHRGDWGVLPEYSLPSDLLIFPNVIDMKWRTAYDI